MMASVRMFEALAHAATYATFRPTYPRAVFDIISTFMEKNGGSGFDVAVDVACGSGQSTFSLCSLFQKVIGVDISEAQISNARAKAAEILPESRSVEFMVGDAHNLPLESSSADLISCAMGWHWLDPEPFYREVKRVLKPKGCLAVYGYGPGSESVGDHHCQKLVLTYIDHLKEKGFWHERSVHCENNYAAAKLPFKLTERYEFPMVWKTDLTHLVGFLSSTSLFPAYCQKYPDSTLLEDLQRNYLSAKGKNQTNPKLEYIFTGFAILGQNDGQ